MLINYMCLYYLIFMFYPLVNIHIAIEKGPVEIVDLPSYNMVDLPSSLCKRLPDP